MDTYQISLQCPHCSKQQKVIVSPSKKLHDCSDCGKKLISSTRIKGYVYVMHNPTTKMIKVGLTEGDVEERAKQLSTTGVPGKYRVEAYFPSHNPAKDEAKAHKKLSKFLVDKELFRLPAAEAIAKVSSALSSREPLFISKGIEEEVKTIKQANRDNMKAKLGK